MTINKSSYQFSLVVTTLGRFDQLVKLFESLAHQSFTDFEIVVVDQNNDDRLANLFTRQWPFRVIRIHTPTHRGVSLGRNIGWRASKGVVIIFPDDDCWYPLSFLQTIDQRMRETEADILTGRATDETGRSINGRYALSPQAIDRSNVWISGIEWTMAFKKSVLETADGFDEQVGVGSPTPWQACEGPELILRALATGFKCYFDPAVYGHHEELNIVAPDLAMSRKGRAYGRGLGYVLRIHSFSKTECAMWIVRPLARAALNLAKGNAKPLRYLLNISVGRLEGVLGRTYALQI